jgi:hypothetical protein
VSSVKRNFLDNHLTINQLPSGQKTFCGPKTFPYLAVPWDMKNYFKGSSVKKGLETVALTGPYSFRIAFTPRRVHTNQF